MNRYTAFLEKTDTVDGYSRTKEKIRNRIIELCNEKKEPLDIIQIINDEFPKYMNHKLIQELLDNMAHYDIQPYDQIGDRYLHESN